MELQNTILKLSRATNPKVVIEQVLQAVGRAGGTISSVVVPVERAETLSGGIRMRDYKNGAIAFYYKNTGIVVGVGLRSGLDRITAWYWNADLGSKLGGIGNTKFIPVTVSSKHRDMLSVATRLLQVPTLSTDATLSVAKEYPTLPTTIDGLLLSKVIVGSDSAGYSVNPKYILERKINSFTKYATMDTLSRITGSKAIQLTDVQYSGDSAILFITIKNNTHYKVVVEGGLKSMPTPVVVKETLSKFYTLKPGSIMEDNNNNNNIMEDSTVALGTEQSKLKREMDDVLSKYGRKAEDCIVELQEDFMEVVEDYLQDVVNSVDPVIKGRYASSSNSYLQKLFLKFTAEQDKEVKDIANKCYAELSGVVKQFTENYKRITGNIPLADKMQVEILKQLKDTVSSGAVLFPQSALKYYDLALGPIIQQYSTPELDQAGLDECSGLLEDKLSILADSVRAEFLDSVIRRDMNDYMASLGLDYLEESKTINASTKFKKINENNINRINENSRLDDQLKFAFEDFKEVVEDNLVACKDDVKGIVEEEAYADFIGLVQEHLTDLWDGGDVTSVKREIEVEWNKFCSEFNNTVHECYGALEEYNADAIEDFNGGLVGIDTYPVVKDVQKNVEQFLSDISKQWQTLGNNKAFEKDFKQQFENSLNANVDGVIKLIQKNPDLSGDELDKHLIQLDKDLQDEWFSRGRYARGIISKTIDDNLKALDKFIADAKTISSKNVDAVDDLAQKFKDSVVTATKTIVDAVDYDLSDANEILLDKIADYSKAVVQSGGDVDKKEIEKIFDNNISAVNSVYDSLVDTYTNAVNSAFQQFSADYNNSTNNSNRNLVNSTMTKFKGEFRAMLRTINDSYKNIVSKYRTEVINNAEKFYDDKAYYKWFNEMDEELCLSVRLMLDNNTYDASNKLLIQFLSDLGLRLNESRRQGRLNEADSTILKLKARLKDDLNQYYNKHSVDAKQHVYDLFNDLVEEIEDYSGDESPRSVVRELKSAFLRLAKQHDAEYGKFMDGCAKDVMHIVDSFIKAYKRETGNNATADRAYYKFVKEFTKSIEEKSTMFPDSSPGRYFEDELEDVILDTELDELGNAVVDVGDSLAETVGETEFLDEFPSTVAWHLSDVLVELGLGELNESRYEAMRSDRKAYDGYNKLFNKFMEHVEEANAIITDNGAYTGILRDVLYKEVYGITLTANEHLEAGTLDSFNRELDGLVTNALVVVEKEFNNMVQSYQQDVADASTEFIREYNRTDKSNYTGDKFKREVDNEIKNSTRKLKGLLNKIKSTLIKDFKGRFNNSNIVVDVKFINENSRWASSASASACSEIIDVVIVPVTTVAKESAEALFDYVRVRSTESKKSPGARKSLNEDSDISDNASVTELCSEFQEELIEYLDEQLGEVRDAIDGEYHDKKSEIQKAIQEAIETGDYDSMYSVVESALTSVDSRIDRNISNEYDKLNSEIKSKAGDFKYKFNRLTRNSVKSQLDKGIEKVLDVINDSGVKSQSEIKSTVLARCKSEFINKLKENFTPGTTPSEFNSKFSKVINRLYSVLDDYFTESYDELIPKVNQALKEAFKSVGTSRELYEAEDTKNPKISPEERRKLKDDLDSFYANKKEAKATELKKSIQDRDKAIEDVLQKYSVEKEKIQREYSKNIQASKTEAEANKLRAERDEALSRLSVDKATAIENLKERQVKEEATIREKYQTLLDKKLKEYQSAIGDFGADVYRDVKNSVTRGINSNPIFQ